MKNLNKQSIKKKQTKQNKTVLILLTSWYRQCSYDIVIISNDKTLLLLFFFCGFRFLQVITVNRKNVYYVANISLFDSLHVTL